MSGMYKGLVVGEGGKSRQVIPSNSKYIVRSLAPHVSYLGWALLRILNFSNFSQFATNL